MNEYSPESKSSGRRVKVELDLSNYATSRFSKCKGVVYPNLFKKVDLAN